MARSKSSRRLVVGVALCGLLAPRLAAWADEEPQWAAVFADRTEVRLINLDVVVTDERGVPVTGLGPQDFLVRHDGEEVQVTNFYAVERGEVITLETVPAAAAGADAKPAPPTPPPVRQLTLVLYVDDANISPNNRARVLGKVKEFLLGNVEPGTRLMLVAHGGDLEVRQPLTDAPHDLFAALEELERTAAAGPRPDLDLDQILRQIAEVNVESGVAGFGVKAGDDVDAEMANSRAASEASAVYNQMRAYVERRAQHLRTSLRHLRTFVDTAAGLPGKKVLVYVSDGLALNPGAAVYEAYTRRFEALGSQVGASPETEAARDDQTAEFLDLVADANASGVTFYPLNGAQATGLARGSAATTGSAGGNFGTFDSGVELAEARTGQESLILMAEGTGGRAGLTPAALASTLAGIATDFDNHYSLGFPVTERASGERRKVEVEVRRPGLTLRYRNSFREKTAEEKVAARTLGALLMGGAENPLGIALRVEEQREEKDGTYVVPLRIQVPLGKLVLLPGETAHQAQVSMYVAARDEKGRTSEVVKHLCPIRIPNQEVLVALGRSATCGVQLRMRKGEQEVAVSVRDELSALESTASLALSIPGGATGDTTVEGAR